MISFLPFFARRSETVDHSDGKIASPNQDLPFLVKHPIVFSSSCSGKTFTCCVNKMEKKKTV